MATQTRPANRTRKGRSPQAQARHDAKRKQWKVRQRPKPFPADALKAIVNASDVPR